MFISRFIYIKIDIKFCIKYSELNFRHDESSRSIFSCIITEKQIISGKNKKLYRFKLSLINEVV